MNKYLFVINPVSGGLDKEDLMGEIRDFCSAQSCGFEIFFTTGENDQEKIRTRIRDQNPDVMVVGGGDGTINMTIPLILEFNLELGLIPAGSANGLATEMGITSENAFQTLSRNVTRPMDIVLLDEEKYMTHLADFGLNAMMVRRYEEEKRRGLLGYAISALKEIGMLEEPFKVTVETNGMKKEFLTKFLVIANATKYGTGFTVNPAGDIGDQKVELCILKEISPSLIFDHLIDDEATDGSNNFFDILSGNSFSIKLNKPVDFQSDGEFIAKKDQLKVRILDQQVRVIAPR